MADKKIVGETHKISDKRGNGKLRREIWVDRHGQVTRYNLADINHRIFSQDNGRVLGYDNAHDGHHRHHLGEGFAVEFVSFEEIERRFEEEWMTRERSEK